MEDGAAPVRLIKPRERQDGELEEQSIFNVDNRNEQKRNCITTTMGRLRGLISYLVVVPIHMLLVGGALVSANLT